MKKLLVALAFLTAIWSAPAAAQCNGKFNASSFCGTGASSGPPGQQPYSAIFNTLPLANGDIFVGNASNIATAVAPTGTGDCTFTFTNLGVFGFTCLKTNNVAFGALATQSSVTLAQLPSPFTNGSVQNNTGFFATYTNNTPIVNNHIAVGDGSGGLKDGGGSTGTLTSVACGTGLSCSPSPIVSTGTVTNTGVVTVKKQVFTSSGTYTPSTGMLFAMIECVGSGGGGGGANGATTQGSGGGGGGSGSYSRVLASAATVGPSQTVTINNAGGGGSGSNNGSNGGDVSVGAICVGKGGGGGAGASSSGTSTNAGGAGGVAGTGDITAVGSNGGNGINISSSALVISGFGAASHFGGGVQGGMQNSTACVTGGAGGNYGAGGAGAVCNNTATATTGGAGSKGVVYITEYNSQ